MIALSPDQVALADALTAGKNCFVTGSAGTGKTFTIRSWLDYLERAGKSGDVAVTASTGIAATHLAGRTIHSWSGAGLCDRPAATIAHGEYWRHIVKGRIQATKRLLIDEISMLDGAAFSLISRLCGIAKGNREPFGGLQVVLVGDLAQLPPVEEEQRGFAFETQEWNALKLETHELTHVFRQADRPFVAALQEVRVGKISDEALALLEGRVRAFDPDAVPAAVRLMTHNAQVEEVNLRKLAALAGEEHVYTAQEEGDPKGLEALDKHCLSPRVLKLKVGARVMFTKNHTDGYWANGTLGTVTDCGAHAVTVAIDGKPSLRVEQVDFKLKTTFDAQGRDKEVVRWQIPLRLAWAITVHKSQGMTIPRVSVELARAFAPGQAYVALSRAGSLEGLNIEAWSGRASVHAHPAVLRYLGVDSAPKWDETLLSDALEI